MNYGNTRHTTCEKQHFAQVRVIDNDGQFASKNAIFLSFTLLIFLTYTFPLIHPVVTVSFSPQNYTVSEGIPVTLGMVLDKEASESITVFVTTMDITAGSADYVQETSIPIVFAPGTTRAWLPLLTLRDTVINEPDEYFKVTLDLEPTTVRVEVGTDICFVTICDATGKSAKTWLICSKL